MRRAAVALATAGGVGFTPVAPGTAGAAVGVVIYLMVSGWSIQAQLALLLAIVVIGVWASTETERHLNVEDPGQVVIDEVAGQFVTLIATGASGLGVAIGFGLFRFFDIVKPPPVRQCEAWHGGTGIMADDVMAGIYGHLALRTLLWAIPGIS